MAEIDYRAEKQPVARVTSPVITHLVAGTATVVVTMKNVNMTVQAIVYRAGDSTNNITRTLNIKDLYGAQYVNKASLADATPTPLNALKGTPDFEEFCINGDLTITITPSGAAGNAAEDYVDLLGV